MKKEFLSKIAYYSFYLAVVIEVLSVIADKSALINPIEGRLFQLTFLLFFLKVCLTKYSWKEYLAVFLFLGLGAISYFATGRNEIIRIVMFIAACKDIDMKKCLKLVFWMTLCGCVLLILLSLTGILGTVSLTMDYGRGEVEKRYTLGLGHPNSLQCMVWALTTLGLYLYGEGLKWYHYAAVLFLNIGFFLLTDSKTSLLAAVLVIAMFFAVRIIPEGKMQKAGMLLSILTTVLTVIFSVVIAFRAYRLYEHIKFGIRDKESKLLLKIDRFLTGRIKTLTGTTRWEGTVRTWTPFSEPQNNHYFDMGWIRLFYWYGIIPALIIILLLLAWMIYCYNKKEYMTLVLIANFSIYTVFEAHIISVYLARNYLLFLFGAVWTEMLLGDNRRRKKESRALS